MIVLETSALRAEITTQGAELLRLQDEAGRDVLWDGDPTYWAGRAPILFPIVGKVPDDAILVGGRRFPIRQHGFARLSAFELVEATETSCRLVLRSSAVTLAHYPFPFRLEVSYGVAAATLAIGVTLHNSGSVPLPASVGFHPALRWPLPGAADKSGHVLIFERPEPRSIRRLREGLLSERREPSPLAGRVLALDEALFVDGVAIFDNLASRKIEYVAPGAPAVRIAFAGMPHLGLWSKPGAGFVCIEPWHGYAAPETFAGELAEKPGIVHVAPGEAATFGMSLAVGTSGAGGAAPER